jgi:hypothetical protein
MAEPIAVRVALHGERIESLEEEGLRTRDRLHNLESDRIALRLIAQRVDDMAEAAKVTAHTVSSVSDDVKALVLAEERRSGERDARSSWLSSRRFVVTTLLAGAAVIVALVSALATLIWA